MNSHQDWQLLIKVPDLIQRDFLVNLLGDQQIEIMAPDRDVIVSLGGGPNLSLEGYSALFDGYSVLVLKKDFSKAQEVLNEFEKTRSIQSTDLADHMSKFHLSAILSFVLPGVLHGLALYHLALAVQKKQFKVTLQFLFSSFVFLVTSLVILSFLTSRFS
jgi:hypothetical protein